MTRPQVLSCGATDGWLKWAIQDGRLVRCRQGVYAVRGSSSRYQELMSACLAGSPSAAASHLEAAALLGARQVLTGAPCVTTFDGCCFETNYQVRTAAGLVLIDFAWPYPKVGLEYHGARDHGSRLARRDDARRRALLTNLGWRIFDANSAVAPAEVVRWVLEALAA